MLIVIPAICNEDGSPFGDASICSVNATSYASFSMAVKLLLLLTNFFWVLLSLLILGTLL